jgi:excisionase family DNA binding protein
MVALLQPIPGAMKVLGISRSTLYELMARGELEVVKIGRRTLIPAESLERYVARLRANVTPAA